jgi:hypothetical protein
MTPPPAPQARNLNVPRTDFEAQLDAIEEKVDAIRRLVDALLTEFGINPIGEPGDAEHAPGSGPTPTKEV